MGGYRAGNVVILHTGWGFRNKLEDGCGQDEHWLRRGSNFNTIANTLTELPERWTPGLHGKVGAKNRRQCHSDRTRMLCLARNRPPIQQTIKEEVREGVG